MSMISASDQQQLRESFAAMRRPVRLLFFTQTFGCETCLPTRQILDELPPLCDKITIEEANLVLDRERAAGFGVDHAPSIVLLYESDNQPPTGSAAAERSEQGPDALQDSRMRFVGLPGGYEFVSLVQAILLAGGRPSSLQPENQTRVSSVDRPIRILVFTTPTCPHCPRAVALALEMAAASPNITAYAIEATEYPDLTRKYQVSGVPKTVVDDRVEILGALPEDDFIDQALAPPTSSSNG
jgi:thiol-disulfide isomerase/thioredoxin